MRSRRGTDPDDCFALLFLLTGAPELSVVGISTVHGNAPLAVTDPVTRELVGVIGTSRPVPPVYRGSAYPPTPRSPWWRWDRSPTSLTPWREPAAAARLLDLGLPLTLVPSEAAREVTARDADHRAIAGAGPAGAWVVTRCQG